MMLKRIQAKTFIGLKTGIMAKVAAVNVLQ